MEQQQYASQEHQQGFSQSGGTSTVALSYSASALVPPGYPSANQTTSSSPGPNYQNRNQINASKDQRRKLGNNTAFAGVGGYSAVNSDANIADNPPSQFQPGSSQYPYYPGYVYMNGLVYPQAGNFGSGSQSNIRMGSTEAVPGKQAPISSVGGASTSAGYFTPRASPTTRQVRTPMTSPLNQSVASQPYPPSGPTQNHLSMASQPYYGNNRLPNTPTGSRRFTHSAFPVSPNFPVSSQQSTYFMSANPNVISSPIVNTTVSGLPGTPLRRASDGLASPASFRRSRRETSSGSEWETEVSMTNLYIKGLKNSCTDDDLYNMCKVFGNIHSSKAILDLTTHECKGFGFVMYETIEEAQYALTELAKLGYNVSFAKETFNTKLKNLQDEESTNVYVSNLPLEMDEEGMLKLFAPHTVISTKILRDPATQLSRGVGFARMDSRASATAVIGEFNGTILESGQCLQVRFADSAAQKRFKTIQQGLSPSPIRGSGFSSPARSWPTPVPSIPAISESSEIQNMAGPSDAPVEPVTNNDEAISSVGYMPYYEGYAPNGVILAPPTYPYPPHQQYNTGTSGSNTPHVIYGAHYYPPPPANSSSSVALQGSQQPVMFQSHPHHPYMVPVHTVYQSTAQIGSVVAPKPPTPTQEYVPVHVSDTAVEGAVAEAAEGNAKILSSVDSVDDALAEDLSGLKV
ncbi:hypothetical protein BC830DRAFT_1078950 [Chytriomyces sp. MP71]|nr:hypothetical protein BC830DRAFT_1078950 [Chytriomyces sp. MP71]